MTFFFPYRKSCLCKANKNAFVSPFEEKKERRTLERERKRTCTRRDRREYSRGKLDKEIEKRYGKGMNKKG